MRDLFIGIVAAKPRDLPELPDKTYRYMQDLVVWARRQNFETWLFSDKNKPLSGPGITKYIEKKNFRNKTFPNESNGLHNRRCIFIYFCGHGYSRGRYEQFWILNNGENTWQDRLDVMSMKEIVEKYQPEHIRLFGDACAEPRDIQGGSSPVFPDPLNSTPPRNIRTDMFFASSRGSTTLANGDGPVFSQVVRRAILDSPIPQEALDKMVSIYEGQPTVTNRSLRTYIEPRFDNLVSKLNGNAVPWMIPDVDHPGCIYRQETDPLTRAKEKTPIGSQTTPGPTAKAEQPSRPIAPETSDVGHFSLLDSSIDQISSDLETILKNVSSGLPNPFKTRYQVEVFHDVNRPGIKFVQYESGAVLVPEFSGFETMVSAGRIDDFHSEFSLKLLPSNHLNITRIQESGGLLLHELTAGNSDFDTLKVLVEQARDRLYEDPLAPLSLAYLYEASGKRRTIKELFLDLAARTDKVAIDLALLARIPIRYDAKNQKLLAHDIPLSTQLPILNRGWSILFTEPIDPVFSPLQQIKYLPGTDAHTVLREEYGIRIISKWMLEYFGNFPELYEEAPKTQQ
ncbi:hypothetical protein SAMN04487962_1172 [Marinobacter segnicrescens]|uniref:Caspase domain-containing protein n=1 Tax=Marinobacter segnicrescens TaxID=430453 RepID=A0A1I0GE81_9GAMM|nr:hypothetical protein [Marinobacter segnicrescens]SET68323.1 hypothetical protein SAMN04487962_1172 [Marinobacter segnicrescens]